MSSVNLDPQTLLAAYAQGAFPMADPDGAIQWYSADPRGILPLDAFHASKTLLQTIRQGKFEVSINTDFRTIMSACRQDRPDGSWINDRLIDAYVALHELGFAHSVECRQNGELVGGLYGVSLRGAFFGESMFHRVRDASKVALVTLVERLRERGYVLLDTQASTPHLARFGCIQIPSKEYLQRLEEALEIDCSFD